MKRRLLVILLLLLGGAIVNVAVAWGFAVAVNLTDGTRLVGIAGDGTSKWQGMAFARTGGYLFTSTWWPNNLPPYAYQSSLAEIVPMWSPAGKASPFTSADTDQSESHNDLIDARGWPMLALLSWVENRGGTDTRKAGIELKSWPRNVGNGRTVSRTLPTHPIWLGFAINTAFYTAILSMLFAPFALRRWRRVERGLCMKCGYNLRNRPSDSSACPECGSIRKC